MGSRKIALAICVADKQNLQLFQLEIISAKKSLINVKNRNLVLADKVQSKRTLKPKTAKLTANPDSYFYG